MSSLSAEHAEDEEYHEQTEAALLGLPLINAIDQEGQDIDANEDIYDCLCHIHSMLLLEYHSSGLYNMGFGNHA